MKKVLALMLALAMVMTMFVACGKKEEEVSSVVEESSVVSEAGSSSAAEGGYEAYSLACVYSEVTGDFWGIVADGCKAALAELKADYGIEGYCIAPANSNDYTLQMDLLETAKLKNVDGIVLSPSNADAIGTFVTDTFTDDSIPIIVIDRSLNTTSPAVKAQCMADTYSMGWEAGKLAAEAMGNKGNYVCYGISPENQNWANRSYGAMDYIAENAPDMEHIWGEEPYWGNQNTDDQILQWISDMITSNPGPLAFLTTTEAGTNKVAAMISEVSADRQKELFIIGYDFSKTGYELIVNGVLYGTVGQNPYLMGYNSTYLMCDYLSGVEIDEVSYVPYCIVTGTNLETPEVKEYFESMKLDI